MAEKPLASPFSVIGKDYTTPDLRAKLTGSARYSEDFRAEGMLYCRLLTSPMPHARVKRLDTSAALAMPGVKAVVTVDDLPAPADAVTDTGAVIKADKWTQRGLTMEPLYQGEPVLAVAAVDELTAAEAIEKIEIEFEPLPFVIDPLESLKPGGPNARTDGNVWMKSESGKGQAEVRELKWSSDDFKKAPDGLMPTGKAAGEWSYGDLDAGFSDAALVLDESFTTPNTNHIALETRSTLAYWQNGKVFIHSGTQSTMQTVPAIARWLNVDTDKVVFVSEYTGGGFGGKITASIQLIIPAVLAKKTGVPVMMRISRDDEYAIGGVRPSLHGRMKAGFSREGRLLALDLFVVQDNGPYAENHDAAAAGMVTSLLYQPQAMRWRGLSVLTNTPFHVSQTAPGGLQGVAFLETLMAKAARRLGMDQLAIRRLNAPAGKAPLLAPGPDGKRPYCTSSFVRQALDRGAELFAWQERTAQNRDGADKGSMIRGLGVSLGCFVAGSTGYDGLFVIRPDGTVRIQSGIGNLGTESVSDSHRVVAESLGVPWERCKLVWGDTGKHLPWTCVSGGSQTIHAMTRAALAACLDAKKKLCEIAAKARGGSPDDYEVAGGRVLRRGGGEAMGFAEAAARAVQLGGAYDGHEFPDELNRLTKASVQALAGQGLLAVGKDTFGRDGRTFSYVASFAEVEVDRATGMYRILDFLVVGDVGVVVHPRALGGQLLGRSMLGIGHAVGQGWVYDTHYGLPLAKRFYHSRPPTILDAPERMRWDALGIPDPETPIGARGVGEPPTTGACSAVLNALRDALGDDAFRRAPVTADTVLDFLESGRFGRSAHTAG